MTTLALSDAIRLGAMLRPQCFESLFDWDTDDPNWDALDPQQPKASCALGAALHAAGRVTQVTTVGDTQRIWPVLTRPARCPVCGRSNLDTFNVIMHLNDIHRWTREAIAAWVATIEAREQQPITEPVAVHAGD